MAINVVHSSPSGSAPRLRGEDDRGGVLGAMESMYHRGKIQEESLYYEHQKHSGELPINGVNTLPAKDEGDAEAPKKVELMRSVNQDACLQHIRLLIETQQVRVSRHAQEEMDNEDFGVQDALFPLKEGQILEDYPGRWREVGDWLQ